MLGLFCALTFDAKVVNVEATGYNGAIGAGCSDGETAALIKKG